MHVHIAPRNTDIALITAAHASALRDAANACLVDVEALVDGWFEQLGAIPVYQEGLVHYGLVRSDCRLVFQRLLGEIGGASVTVEAANISERVGHSRALRGIPLSDVLAAIRLDFRVIWDALLVHLGTSDSLLLTESVPRIWEAIERHSQDVTKAYTLTQHGMTHAQQDENRLWFSRLIETDGSNHVLNVRACESLGYEAQGEFTIIARGMLQDEPLELLNAELVRRGHISQCQPVEEGTIIVAQLDETNDPTVIRWLNSIDSSLVLLGPVTGVHLVPAGVRLVHAVATSLPLENGTTTVEEHWPLAALCAPLETTRILSARYLDPFHKLPTNERQALESTAASYIETGSIAETARREYFHRNTVTNRLEHIASLTGLDLRRPRDAATWLLAKAAHARPHLTRVPRSE